MRREDEATATTVGAEAGAAPTRSFAPVLGGVPGDLALPTIAAQQYERLGELGRGGMGRITAARDRRLGREVAIKELARDDAVAAARFEREATITARLQHPGIIPIYEAGRWPSGEPFYAMKRVDGRSLLDAIAAAATLPERMALLRVVIAASEAIAYAHRRGVVHRDLKPANILLGEFGETVVIDWGLAKELGELDEAGGGEPARDGPGDGDGHGALTVAGHALGTPAYMPPEQARGGAVDRRADVYALGALLYHVLTGQAPYHDESAADTLERVLAGPPPAVAALAPAVPADLTAIVDRAMARAPADRYPSGEELAADLIRFQTGQLVGAHAYSGTALLRRWLRRHRTPVAVGAVLLAVLAVTAVVSVRRIVRERRRADQGATLARTQRGAAEQLVSYVVYDLRERLVDLGRLDLLAGVAEQVDAYYGEVAAAAGSLDADAARRRAQALLVAGDVERNRGDLAAASRAYDRAHASLAALVAANPGDREAVRALADSLRRRGHVARSSAGHGDPEALLRAAQDHYRALLAGDPDDTLARIMLADCHGQLADLYRDGGRVAEAQAQLGARLTLRQDIAETNRDDVDAQRQLGEAYASFGDARVAASDLAGADAEYQAGLDRLDALAAAHPGDHDLDEARALYRRRAGSAAMRNGDYPRALAHFRAALAISEELSRREPDNARWRTQLADAHFYLADVERNRGDVAAARVSMARARVLAEELVARDPSDMSARNNLSVIYRVSGNLELADGRTDAALRDFARCAELREELVRADPADVKFRTNLANVELLRADVLLDGGFTAESLQRARRAHDLYLQVAVAAPGDGTSWSMLARSEGAIGRGLAASGDRAGAEAAQRRSLALQLKLGAEHPDDVQYQVHLARAEGDLAAVLAEQPKRRDEARRLRAQAIARMAPFEAAGRLEPAALHLLGELRARRP